MGSYILHKFEAKLQYKENRVTATDGYWLVALSKGSPWVGSFRGPLGRGLTIRSPKVGLGPFSATFLYISRKFVAKLHQKENGVTAADGYWLVALGKGSPREAIFAISLRRSYNTKKTV